MDSTPAPDGTSSPGSRARLASILLGLALLGLYLSSLTAANTYDAVIYAQIVERVASGGGVILDFFNPAHVLHLPLGALVVAMLQACGVAVGGLLVLQLLAAVAGAALGALLALHLSRECGLPLALATAVAASLAAGTWFFATDGETNHLGLAFAVAALGPSVRLLGPEARGRDAVAAGLLLAGAAAFHLTLGTLWIALAALALLARRDRLRPIVLALVVASAALAVAYVPRVVMLQRTMPGWKPKHVVSFVLEAPGGGYLMQEGFEPLREWWELTRSFAPESGALTIVASLLPWAWLLAGVAALLLRRGGILLRLSALWLAATIALYAAWASINFEFACFMSTPLAVFGACGLGALLRPGRPRAIAAAVTAALAALVAVGAWRSAISPGLDPQRVPDRRLADEIAEATSPGDCVLVSEVGSNLSKVYVAYFGYRRALIPEFTFGPAIPTEESVRRIARQASQCCSEGGRLFALPALVDDVEHPPVAWDVDAVRGFLRRLDPRPVPGGREGALLLYELRCPTPADAP